jgi:hypothetical protein
MAKRKAAGAAKRSKRTAGKGSRKAAARKTSARKATARKAAGRKPAARKGAARKAARKGAAKKAAARGVTTRIKRSAKSARSRSATKRARPTIKRAAPPSAAARERSVKAAPVARKAPALSRERRTAPDDDVVPSPPSSLDLDRSASAVRSGRREMKERYAEHTETSPALTAGDVDADWESAYSVGDEAPGGDNPTPDQDIVDDIGKAVGNEYQDNEELKGADKIARRDKHRWELDPASSEDYDDR